MRKVLIGTALLGILGALAGAASGALATAIALAANAIGGESHVGGPELQASLVIAFVCAIGFVAGAFAAPLLTWTLLRRVPLWRAAVETAVAASLGFVAVAFTLGNLLVAGVTAAGLATLAAVRLRRAFPAVAAAPVKEEL